MNTHPISEVYNMDCMEYMKSVPDKFYADEVLQQKIDFDV